MRKLTSTLSICEHESLVSGGADDDYDNEEEDGDNVDGDDDIGDYGGNEIGP